MDGVIADAVVVAAGRSERMGGLDKLEADLGGRPVLAWSIAALAASPLVERIVLVRGSGEPATRPAWLPAKVMGIVPGGSRRQDSVLAGVRALEGDGGGGGGVGSAGRVVLVHDGARPLVSTRLVDAVARAAAEHGAAIPVLPVAETLKRVDGDIVGETIERSGAVTAQTPQGIRWDVLRDALARLAGPGHDAATPTRELSREFTDEAALLQAAGIEVRTVPGEAANRKITTPEDLALAEAHVRAGATTRVGLGTDGHAFGPGLGLRLGGIEIANAPRLHGHSDGDAALHAIAGALLGAAALGDLGSLHPADARTPLGVASADLLADVRRRLAAEGWRPSTVDVTIRAGRPRLGAALPAMRDAIAGLLGLSIGDVSVKAATGNLSGDAGAGRSIEAEAIATIERSDR